MAPEKDSTTGSGTLGGTAETDDSDAADGDDAGSGSFRRRSYLKGLGATAAALGGIGAAVTPTAAAPPNSDNWSLAFEDQFDGGSLDTSKWSVGFGWGLETNTSAESISSSQVDVRDGALHLTAEHDDGDVLAGAINTKDKHYYGPGTYWESRIKLPKREGFLPAFWAKPNSEAWPPELDFIELFQNDGSRDDWTHANYNIHYSTSTEPGDGSTHTADPTHYDTGMDLTQEFHTYGCKWLTDRVEFYFDGQKVGESTNSTALTALQKGAPFYMMLNIHIDKVGQTDRTETWTEEMVVDWTRVWTQSGDSTSSGGSTDDGSSDDSTDSTQEHYLWVRSGDGDPVTFAFDAGGGNVEIGSGGSDADYWVTDDGTTAGGTTAKRGNLPGFWYEGSITDFSYEGSIEVYVDDSPVDPSTLEDTGESGPSDPSETSGSPEYEHVVAVDGTVADGSTSYSMTASDGIGPVEGITAEDSISGSTATGGVGAGVDTYGFDGSLTALSLDGPAGVFVDGERLDRLEVSRDGDSSGSVKYLIETDGGVAGISPSALGEDRVTDRKILGTVEGGTDSYWLDGASVVDVSAFGGSVETTLNGSRFDRTD